MDQTTFVKLMTQLRACYPQRVSDAEHWKLMIGRYWDDLSTLADEVVIEAFRRAHRHFPEFFPALGAFGELCTLVARQQRDRGSVMKLPEVSSADGVITPEIRALIDQVKRV